MGDMPTRELEQPLDTPALHWARGVARGGTNTSSSNRTFARSEWETGTESHAGF